MSDTKFTKGRWEVDINASWQNPRNICKISDVVGVSTSLIEVDGEAVYDAHLIAAAPDMYVMLEDLFDGGGLHRLDEIAIVELLAKARGE